MKKKRSGILSDHELQTLLKGLRQDVAAPADFRARVLARLVEEGLLSAVPRPAAPGRLRVWFSPLRLGLGLSAAAALLWVFNALPERRFERRVAPAAPSVAVPTAPASTPAPRRPSAPPVLAGARKSISHPTPATVAEPVVSAGSVELGSAPVASALGSVSQPAVPGGVSVSEIHPKPTVIVIEPTPTPLERPLRERSEVRNNVVRVSRGQAALIFFTVETAGRVRVEIHDRLGRRVAALSDRDFDAGDYSLSWAGAADQGGMAASGVYQVSIQTPTYVARHKLVLVK